MLYNVVYLYRNHKGYNNKPYDYKHKGKKNIVINKQIPIIMKEVCNKLCSDYQDLLRMSEDEVMAEYGISKDEVVKAYEEEIDWYESRLYN